MSVTLISLRMRSGSFINYSYLLIDPMERQAVVIDPAWELEKLMAELRLHNAALRAILLTHSHFDHVNLVPALSERAMPDVFMSRKEIEHSGFRCKSLHALEDMDSLSFGKMAFTSLLTPGHTVGSMCFLIEDSLFTGDTLFAEGCGICHGAGGSAEEMYNSIQKLKAGVGKHVRVYPGHSFGMQPGQTMEHLWKYNIYMQLERRHFIHFRMREQQPRMFDFQ